MQVIDKDIFPIEAAEVAAKMTITPEVLSRSMPRLEYTTAIDPDMVQEEIDYLAELGYISGGFDASQILDLRFLE